MLCKMIPTKSIDHLDPGHLFVHEGLEGHGDVAAEAVGAEIDAEDEVFELLVGPEADGEAGLVGFFDHGAGGPFQPAAQGLDADGLCHGDGFVVDRLADDQEEFRIGMMLLQVAEAPVVGGGEDQLRVLRPDGLDARIDLLDIFLQTLLRIEFRGRGLELELDIQPVFPVQI